MTKHYKLKKDLPTFKAGDEFCLNNEGDLVSLKERVVAYSAKTLEKFPNILKDWFKEIEESAIWRGKIGQTYWWFDDTYGYADVEIENRDAVDEFRYKIGNYFKTKKEAEKYGEYLIALQVIKDDAKGFVPDWDDSDDKYHGYYDHSNGFLGWCDARRFQNQGTIYFNSEKDIEKSLKKHRKEWLTVLGVKNEDTD